METGYLIDYECPHCGREWQDTWSCACNSECPECGAEDIEAGDYELDGTRTQEELDAYNSAGDALPHLDREPVPVPRSYKPEVQADASGKWYDNALRFATRKEAEASARDLMERWMLVTECRAAESDEPATHTWIDGKLGYLPKAQLLSAGVGS